MSQRRPGYSHRRSSLVTRGITTHVISDTVASVVTASRGTSGRPPISGAATITTTVIRGKIVTQVTSAILYGGGAAAPGRQGEPALQPGEELGPHRAGGV